MIRGEKELQTEKENQVAWKDFMTRQNKRLQTKVRMDCLIFIFLTANVHFRDFQFSNHEKKSKS